MGKPTIKVPVELTIGTMVLGTTVYVEKEAVFEALSDDDIIDEVKARDLEDQFEADTYSDDVETLDEASADDLLEALGRFGIEIAPHSRTVTELRRAIWKRDWQHALVMLDRIFPEALADRSTEAYREWKATAINGPIKSETR